MVNQLLIADCVVDIATEVSPRRRMFVSPFLVVEFQTELEEPFVFATMEVASE
ncbi:MAG TPA: hypothetical protein VJZ76_21680 [Thermoanaerobaculia bacterium]|nr:hypothetical protein [Thermoanaerobaculia bacterium]